MYQNKLNHIIVSGAAGFIGSHLCDQLLNSGYRVTGIDNMSHGSINNLSGALQHPLFDFHHNDLAIFLQHYNHSADVIIHLASQKIPRYEGAYRTVDENISNTQSVIAYAKRHRCKILFASTSDVYGKNPAIPYHEESDLIIGASTVKRWAYAASKIAAEHLLLGAADAFGLRVLIFRFFGSYGPRHHRSWWGGPQSVFIDQCLQQKALEIHGDGNQIRSFIYIDDLIEGIMKALESDINQGIYNLCTAPDEAVNIKQLAEKISFLTMNKGLPEIKFVPYSEFGNYEDVMKRTGLYDKANRDFGFYPLVSLEEGLRKTIAWHRENPID
jgi:UDP-glucose 4-epimerase